MYFVDFVAFCDFEVPWDPRNTQEAPRRPGTSWSKNMCFHAPAHKSDGGRPISRRRERRDHHRLARLRTRIRDRRGENRRATDT